MGSALPSEEPCTAVMGRSSTWSHSLRRVVVVAAVQCLRDFAASEVQAHPHLPSMSLAASSCYRCRGRRRSQAEDRQGTAETAERRWHPQEYVAFLVSDLLGSAAPAGERAIAIAAVALLRATQYCRSRVSFAVLAGALGESLEDCG